MKLQNIVFPEEDICSNYDMYFRIPKKKSYSEEKGCLYLKKREWAYFDTYFNGFFPCKWKRYTKATNVSLNLKLKGKFKIETVYTEREPNGHCKIKVLQELEVGSERTKIHTIPIGDISDEKVHMYSFSMQALKEDSEFYGGYYSTEIEDDEVRPIKIGLAICTFKREQFIKKNVDNICKKILDNASSEIKDGIEVFIADNGNTLTGTKAITHESVYVHPNKNVGGAGGFSRCLIEIMKSGHGITHALLMDDDIVFDTEVLFRTHTLLSLLREEYYGASIGGAMLRLDDQNIQIESGAIWNKGAIMSLKGGLNLANTEACLFNDVEESAQYNAWWFSAIPTDVITPENLPLPIFIRGDDVEYGIRNFKKVIHMNGICVWHEPFENKYSSFLYYYIFRNRLINNSIHSISYSKEDLIKDLREHWRNEVLRCRYKNASLLLQGVDEFLNGIDWFKEIDGEAKHKEIMGLGYKVTRVDQFETPFMYGTYDASLHRGPDEMGKFKRLMGIAVLPPNRDIAVPLFNPDVRLFHRANTIFNYDYSTGKGFVTKADRKEFFRQLKCYRATVKNINKNYDRIVKEFQERGQELMALDFWDSYLESQKPA
jgi:Predicted glycosyltransferases